MNLLREMETIVKVQYSGRYGHILTEVTQEQRDVLKVLDVQLAGSS